MTSPRVRRVAIAGTLLVWSILFIPSGIAGAETSPKDSLVLTTDVTVHPNAPIPGESFRVRIALRNPSNDSRIDVRRVWLTGTALEDSTSQAVPGVTLPAGTKEVTLNATIPDAGIHQLVVHASARTEGGQTVLSHRRMTVRVGGVHPRLAMTVPEAFIGADTPVRLAVTNGLQTDLHDLVVTLRGEDLERRSLERFAPTLSPGKSTSFQVPVRPLREGSTRVAAVLSYTLDSGERLTVRKTTGLEVLPANEAPAPTLSLRTNDSVVDVASRVEMRVGNGLDSPVRDIQIQVRATQLHFDHPNRAIPLLTPGETAAVSVRTRATEPGPHRVNATLFATVAGERRRVVRTARFDAFALRDDVDIQAQPAPANEGVRVDVFNRGNAPVRDVFVVGRTNDSQTVRGALPVIQPGESGRITLDLRPVASVTRRPLAINASYTIGGRSGMARTSITLPASTASIALTGVRAESEGDSGTISLSGSASNLGLRSATGVVVRVVDTALVEPIQPQRDYFVGTVPASDFVSFDLTARLDGPVTTIPIQVTYLADTHRRTRIFHIPYESGEPDRATTTEPSDATSITSILLGLTVTSAVLGIVVLGWWNRGA